MSDLKQYIKARKERDDDFKDNFEEGYQTFKFGALLREARKQAGLTQLEVAERLHTKKSAISRMENHSEDVKLSTLEKFASAVGKKIEINII